MLLPLAWHLGFVLHRTLCVSGPLWRCWRCQVSCGTTFKRLKGVLVSRSSRLIADKSSHGSPWLEGRNTFANLEVFTRMAGQYVGLITTVTHFRQVIAGKLDDRPETAFYTLSGLEQVCFKCTLQPLLGSECFGLSRPILVFRARGDRKASHSSMGIKSDAFGYPDTFEATLTIGAAASINAASPWF